MRATWRKGLRGFTFIEVLLILAIIGVVATAAAPYARRTMAYARLLGAARQVSGDLRLAQQFAITENVSHKVYFYPAQPQSYYRIYRGSETTPRKEVKLDPAITMEAPSFGGNPYVTFTSDGSPSAGGQVVLKNNLGQQLTVEVSVATGRVRTY